MNGKVEVVGSVADAARNWHLAVGTIFSAGFGVELTPKPRPAGDGTMAPTPPAAQQPRVGT